MPDLERDRAGELDNAERVARAYARGHHILSEIGHTDVSVLMAEYERRADKLELDAEEIRQYRIQTRELRAALAQSQAVVAAARALVEHIRAMSLLEMTQTEKTERWRLERDLMSVLDSDGGEQ